MIEVNAVSKSFKVINRRTGITGLLKDIVYPRKILRKVLQGISCTWKDGERVCVAGRNGTGKSTLLKIIAGVMRPSRGSVIYNGIEVYRHQKKYKRRLGAVFGQRSQLIWELPFIESLRYLRYIYKLERRAFEEAVSSITLYLDLQEFLNVPIREMSLGQRMRCEIAAGVVHRPSVLILDEATIGLDLSARAKIYSLLRFLSETQGTTIIFASHDVHDVIEMAERLMVLNDGIIAYDGSPTAFFEKHVHGRKITITFKEPYEQSGLDLSSFGRVGRISDYEISVTVDTNTAVIALLQRVDLLDHIQDFSMVEDDFRTVLGRYYDEQ